MGNPVTSQHDEKVGNLANKQRHASIWPFPVGLGKVQKDIRCRALRREDEQADQDRDVGEEMDRREDTLTTTEITRQDNIESGDENSGCHREQRASPSGGVVGRVGD